MIYRSRFEICVPTKGIFFERSNELFNEIIIIRPNIIASLDKVCYMLFGISFAIKLLKFRSLITLRHFQVINPLCIWLCINERKSSQAPLKLPEIKNKRESCIKQTKINEINLFGEGLILIDQLKDFIIEVLEDKSESPSKFSPTYSKLYMQMIDNLKMPKGYQPPKLQQFDGKGNPKRHIAHFIKTCNDAGTYGDHLVK